MPLVFIHGVNDCDTERTTPPTGLRHGRGHAATVEPGTHAVRALEPGLLP
jgi:hypothetical protein